MTSRLGSARREITASASQNETAQQPPTSSDAAPTAGSNEASVAGWASSSSSPGPNSSLTLHLEVTDQEVIQALEQFESEDQRHAYANAALKIGVSALQVATGRLDAEVIRRESTHLLQSVSERLHDHTVHVQDRVNHQLREYFDPESGRFNERVKRLVSRDGELEQVLRRQIGAEDSVLAKTLILHFGDKSPLMKRLNPDESEGLVAALRGVVEDQLKQQREHVLQEFSLDNSTSALSRLVKEISRNHGQLQRDIQTKIDDVVKEFSLDQENSALSRLVRNVDNAQRTIVKEFSLDNPESAFSRLNTILRDTQGTIQGNLTLDDENSPLARLKRELQTLLKEHARDNLEFREEVKSTLATLVARREEADKSTRHGVAFEDALGQFLQDHRQSAGDVVEGTGARTGEIKNCKVGDYVIQLCGESQAAGARLVVEAKEDASYTLSRALTECQTARKNRAAQVSIFVFSAKTAPPEVDAFARYGDDLVVVWDAEHAATDVYLQAALTTARALCVRVEQAQESSADFAAINRAILEIEKRAGSLDEVQKFAETIKNSSQKIIDRVERTRIVLRKEINHLQDHVDRWIEHSRRE